MLNDICLFVGPKLKYVRHKIMLLGHVVLSCRNSTVSIEVFKKAFGHQGD